MSKKISLLVTVALLTAAPHLPCQQRVPVKTHAGLINKARSLTTEESLGRDIDFLCSDLCEGRGSGQRGGSEAAMYVAHRFATLGLKPVTAGRTLSLSGSYEGHLCHDIVGMIPANTARGRGRYIIVMAHYDALGKIGDTVYPGADSNASGVAVMLALARMFSYVSSEGGSMDSNLIFAGLDAKEFSLGGAYVLWNALSSGRLVDPMTGKSIKPRDISAAVNLDILGATVSTLKSGREDYLIMLGGDTDTRMFMDGVNRYIGTGLEMAYNYYGSQGFTRLFLDKVSDQKPFREHGVRSVMFTSGITMDTNKETDTPDRLNLPVLLRRTRAIYHWIDRLTYLL